MDNRGLLQDEDNKLRRARQLETGGTKRSSEYNRDLKTEEMNNRQFSGELSRDFQQRMM